MKRQWEQGKYLSTITAYVIKTKQMCALNHVWHIKSNIVYDLIAYDFQLEIADQTVTFNTWLFQTWVSI